MDLLKLIPQLFYDLISRVLPGFIAIVTGAAAANIKLGKLATDTWEGASALQDSALFLGFGFLAGAYLVGQIISPLSDFLENRIIKRLFPAYFQVLKNAVTPTSEYLPAMQQFLLTEVGIKTEADIGQLHTGQFSKAVFVWYDWLRVHDPDSGARAAKIRAEYRMHSQNAVAFIGALVVHMVLMTLRQTSLNYGFVILMVLAGLASIWASARTYRTFQWAVVQQYYSAKTSLVNSKAVERPGTSTR